MKIRNGFVSNSSSTSFTFCFKDKGNGIDDLLDMIVSQKYKNNFQRSFDEWFCNATGVADAIKASVERGGEWNEAKVVSIDKIIADEKDDLKHIKEVIKEAEKKNWTGYYLERKDCLEEKIKKLQKIKKNGLDSVLVIGFGDNDGEVCGGSVGHAMDYDGRYIGINTNELVVFTEQNR